MASDPSVDYTFSLLLTGSASIGKTSLLSRFISNSFNPQYVQTIGMQLQQTQLPINKIVTKLIIYDMAGHELFLSFMRSIERKVACVVVVYDITSYQSYEFAQVRFRELKERLNSSVEFFIIGTKTDLEQQRQVMEEEASIFAHSNAMIFFETSAKTGDNVDICFKIMANKLIGNQIRKKLIADEMQKRMSARMWKWEKLKVYVPVVFFVVLVGMAWLGGRSRSSLL